MKTVSIVFEKDKTYKHLDEELKNAYANKEPLVLHFDLRKMRITSLFSLLKYKPIFEKYRPQTKEYLRHSVIFVHNKAIKTVIMSFLKVLKPEKPTNVLCN